MTRIRTRSALTLLAVALALSACATAPDPRIAALEKRVQQLQDQKEIREVLIRYGEYLDAKDYAGYASLFASDGVWTGGFGSATGPAGIQAMLEKNLGKPEPGYINKTSFHLMTTEVIDVSGDIAKVRSRYIFFRLRQKGVLSLEEYEASKMRILAEHSSERSPDGLTAREREAARLAPNMQSGWY